MKPKSKRPIAIVLGTRPEIIKLSALIRLCERKRVPYFLLHTGQHYSFEMDRVFFKELRLPVPKYRLSVHQSPAIGHGHHVGRMMEELESILLKERPHTVVVQGDTNTVLAGTLVASKIDGMAVAHVEAGLRSYDRQMPEEINRVLCDHASDLLFPPTPAAKHTLLKEGIEAGKIFVTGNTIVDAVQQNLKIAAKRPLVKGAKKPFFLLTMHRQENVDDKKRLVFILEGLRLVHEKLKTPIYFPAHPRTVNKLKAFNVKLPKGIHVHAPAGFLDFLRLEAEAEMALTDSGGVQEETCILKVPCVTLRTTTERPETVTVGGNVIVGYEPQAILRGALKMIGKKPTWKNPFGDGHASERILSTIQRKANGR